LGLASSAPGVAAGVAFLLSVLGWHDAFGGGFDGLALAAFFRFRLLKKGPQGISNQEDLA
jgi:hypothetical protein